MDSISQEKMISSKKTIINLVLKKNKSCLDKFETIEIVSKEILDKLIESKLLLNTFRNEFTGDIFENEKVQLIKYRDNRVSGGEDGVYEIKVNYKKSGCGWGRVNPLKSLAFISIRRELRHTLAEGRYVDIDISNCQVEILYQLCESNGIECKWLKHYCQNRSEWFKLIMDTYNVDRDTAKRLIIRILFYGGFDGWICNVRCGEEGCKKHCKKETILQPIIDLTEEVYKISEIILGLNPGLVDDVVKHNEKMKDNELKFEEREYEKKKKDYEKRKAKGEDVKIPEKKRPKTFNIKATAMSIYLHEWEFRILVIVYLFLKAKYDNLKSVGLCHDGIMLLLEFYYEGLLDDLSKEVKSKTGLNLVFTVKEFDKSLKSKLYEIVEDKVIDKDNDYKDENIETIKEEKSKEEYEEDEFVYTDEDGANYILKTLKGVVYSYQNRIFLKKDNKWIHDIETIQKHLMNLIFDSDMKTKDKKGNSIYFSKNTSRVTSIYKCLLLRLFKGDFVNNKIYSLFHTSTKNKLCFKDGVLDFEKKIFTKWDDLLDNEIFSTVQIDFEFGDYFINPNRFFIDEIKEKIFRPQYGDKLDLILQFLSRGITGNFEDKRWATYLGNRNSGKGVVYELLESSFQEYVRTFELGNMLTSKLTSGTECQDSSKKLYWALDLEFVRLAISQETPSPSDGLILNSKSMKKFTGGGDRIVARRNFDRFDTVFTTDTTFFILGNNSLQATTNDVFESCLQFESTIQFISQEMYDFLEAQGEDIRFKRISDSSIKDKVRSEDFKLAMVYLLFESWIPKAVEIKIDVENQMEDTISIWNQFKELYEITNNPEDAVLCTDVYQHDLFKDKKKINLELSNNNIHRKKSNLRNHTRDKMSFFGIKDKQVTTTLIV